jgi:hypothetical protein
MILTSVGVLDGRGAGARYDAQAWPVPLRVPHDLSTGASTPHASNGDDAIATDSTSVGLST